MLVVGVGTTLLVEGSLPVLMATLGSAFVFSEFENRYRLRGGFLDYAIDGVIRVAAAVLWTGLLYIAKKQYFSD
jgi:hypothetical protein